MTKLWRWDDPISRVHFPMLNNALTIDGTKNSDRKFDLKEPLIKRNPSSKLTELNPTEMLQKFEDKYSLVQFSWCQKYRFVPIPTDRSIHISIDG